MTYSPESHRESVREQHLRLVRDGGPGWHPYALDSAEAVVKEDPTLHGGLVATLEAEIGTDAVKAARRAITWFKANPSAPQGAQRKEKR